MELTEEVNLAFKSDFVCKGLEHFEFPSSIQKAAFLFLCEFFNSEQPRGKETKNVDESQTSSVSEKTGSLLLTNVPVLGFIQFVI